MARLCHTASSIHRLNVFIYIIVNGKPYQFGPFIRRSLYPFFGFYCEKTFTIDNYQNPPPDMYIWQYHPSFEIVILKEHLDFFTQLFQSTKYIYDLEILANVYENFETLKNIGCIVELLKIEEMMDNLNQDNFDEILLLISNYIQKYSRSNLIIYVIFPIILGFKKSKYDPIYLLLFIKLSCLHESWNILFKIASKEENKSLFNKMKYFQSFLPRYNEKYGKNSPDYTLSNHETNINNHESNINNHEANINNHETNINNHEANIIGCPVM